jgi:hypothetical protein
LFAGECGAETCDFEIEEVRLLLAFGEALAGRGEGGEEEVWVGGCGSRALSGEVRGLQGEERRVQGGDLGGEGGEVRGLQGELFVPCFVRRGEWLACFGSG